MDWSSERKAKRRKERKQEGGTRDDVLRGILFENNKERLAESRGSARLSPATHEIINVDVYSKCQHSNHPMSTRSTHPLSSEN